MPRLTKKKLLRIKEHAMGSMYRMNAKTADCYAFTLTHDNEWTGGWDWSKSLVDKDAEYLLMLESGNLVKLWN